MKNELINSLNWLFYIWTLTKKYIKEFKKTDGSTWYNYNLKFDYIGWYEIIRTTKNVYETLQEQAHYTLPIWTSTKKELDFVNLFILSKSWKIYDNEWTVISIPETTNITTKNTNVNNDISIEDIPF